MPAESVRIDGLRALLGDLKHADKELATELRKAVKGAATTVARRSREIAEAEGLRDTGALVASIKAGMKGGAGVVRVTAERNGFRYPAVYEYGRVSPWQESGGIRQFLEPALEAERTEIEADVLKVVDRLVNELARRGATE